MALNPELRSFVQAGLSGGLSRTQISDALARAGWPSDQVKAALESFADIEFPIPVPTPGMSVGIAARDAFLYLVLFSTLFGTTINLGILLFQFIDMAFPDPALAFSEVTRDAIRWSVSSLVVAFPVFLYVSRLTRREMAQHPAKRASRVRRWLTYLTLFVAASILIGDVTSLIYNLLGGELTIRFVLKALTVGAIAGTVFGFYLHDLRRDGDETE